MKFTDLLTDDDAVSPVIGVILMVAITVILAAVIGTFVLGLGENTATAPQASFNFDYNSSEGGNLTITHESGDSITASQLNITAGIDIQDRDGTNVNDSTAASSLTWQILTTDTDVSAGSSVTVQPKDEGSASLNNQTVRIVWTDESGSTSATLQKWSGPDA